MKIFFILFILSFLDLASASLQNCLDKLPEELPQKLSQACLFEDMNHKQIFGEYMKFTPKYPLYTDGMDKRRWIFIPGNKKIDATDVDNWNFPVGTILFKEFSTAGLILETRVLFKFKSGLSIRNWKWATYMWNKKQTEALLVTKGSRNVLGTIHTIPSRGQCFSCHRGSKDQVLGFGAIQLSYADANAKPKEVYLNSLIKSGRFSQNIKPFYKIPANNETERKALGYMHGNCSHCHNQNHPMAGLGLHLKTRTTIKDRSEHDAIKTTVGIPTRGFYQADYRVLSGNAEDSALYMRLNSIQRGIQMAPIGKSTIDHSGVKIFKDWIESL
jgi:hypothetical protein